jgi:hypothetical protein
MIRSEKARKLAEKWFTSVKSLTMKEDVKIDRRTF